jgi:hypothetical protein
MADEPGYQYRAFISYSRNDREVAKRLQRLLEYFVLPAALRVVSAGVTRNVRPLTPCFRDEDELVPGQDLPDRIRRGLESSEYLIVVCSRSSARSEWVEREILDFQRLGRSQNILAVVVDGEPNAKNPDEESLPRALRFQIGPDGQLTDQPAEPLWIDWREHARSDRVTFLRIVAALLSLRSLDELVRRDAQARRRAMAIRLSLTAAGVVALAAVAVGWFRERSAAEAQAIQQALALARADFADDRVDAGLQRLQPFLNGRHADLVEPVIRNVLGWAVPIKQQFAALSRPSLLRYRGALLLLDQNGGLHDLSGIEPVRIILSQDGRRLVLIQSVQVSVFDATNGQRLAQADTLGIKWYAHAFESPDGLLVVLGTLEGATNGGTWYAALTVSKSGAAVAYSQISPIIELSGIAVAGNCQGLLLSHSSFSDLPAFESRRFTSETIEETKAITGGEIFSPIAEGANRFGSILQQDFPESGLTQPHRDITESEPFKPVSTSSNPFLAAGCTQVKSDSGALHASDVTTPLSDPVTLATGSDFEPVANWTRGSAPQIAGSPVPTLCPASAPCPVVDGRGSGSTHTQGEQEAKAFSDDRYGPLPVPRGAPPSATEFNSFAGNPVLFEYYHYNAGTDLAICRTLDGRPICYEESAQGDERRKDDFLRSRKGRYIFWQLGGTVIDLQTLHKVMKLREIATEQTQACDFTPDESQFVCAAGGRLVSYQAGSTGAFWQSTTSAQIGPLQLDSEQKITGLLAIDNNDFISARSDGSVGRFDHSGIVQWQLHVAGIGQISDVLPSPDRKFILLIGQRGMRILNSDGFVQSAPLAPPAVLSGKRPLEACLDRAADHKPYVDLDDTGALQVMCGENDPRTGELFAHSPRTASGAIGDLISGGVCTPASSLSPIDALKMCASQ